MGMSALYDTISEPVKSSSNRISVASMKLEDDGHAREKPSHSYMSAPRSWLEKVRSL